MKTKTHIIGWLLAMISLVALTGCHSLLLPANTPTSKIALKTNHGRYISALGEGEGWSLKQNGESEPGGCEWFTQYNLANGKIALLTCHGRFVTTPRRGTTRLDWEVWQESGLGDCGQFDVVAQGNGFALKTCAGKYLTAGDGNWEPPLQWGIVAETDKAEAWEVFTMVPQR